MPPQLIERRHITSDLVASRPRLPPPQAPVTRPVAPPPQEPVARPVAPTTQAPVARQVASPSQAATRPKTIRPRDSSPSLEWLPLNPITTPLEEIARIRALKSPLHWHWQLIPFDETYKLPTNDLIVKITSKEKFTRFNQAKANREGSTNTGTPQVGDARRFYERGTNRYLTALIIRSNAVKANKEDLELAFWNLHCQMETLQTNLAHLQMSPKIFHPVHTMDALLLLEKQFLSSGIEFHLWFPDTRRIDRD